MKEDRQYKVASQLFELAQDIVPVSRARVVAALVHKNKIIAHGWNQHKTHPMAAQFSRHPEAKCLHAEIACIRNAINRRGVDILKKSTLYIVRAKYDTKLEDFVWGMAKPCSGCMDAILTFEIPQIVYSTDTHNTASMQWIM